MFSLHNFAQVEKNESSCSENFTENFQFSNIQNSSHLLIVLRILIVEIALECQLSAACSALEAAGVKEGEVFERSNAVDLIDDLIAAEACRLVEVGTIHDCKK